MEGFELDLASPDFQNLMVDNRNVVTPGILSQCRLLFFFLIWMSNFTDLLANAMPFVEASGSTAISTRFSLPSILNFNQISYINSTSTFIFFTSYMCLHSLIDGIMPASYSQLQSQALTTRGSIVPANVVIEKLTNRPTGFPISFSMTQQGFMSDISCKQQDLDATSSPSLQILSASQPVFNSTITLAQIRVLCVNATLPSFTREHSGFSMNIVPLANFGSFSSSYNVVESRRSFWYFLSRY